ncbi:MAG: RNA-binding S4 domain-containing protein [Rhodospirillales bacterium]|jgi:ribosome-associated heat shock protein Hsp15|nr:RNA-binding S4 domain-containing protein [Rhodospirillales bacterium]
MNAPGLRLDKWLWQARFYKSRSLAAKLSEAAAMRINGSPVGKAHHLVREGDVLTFVWNNRIRVVRVLALGSRRGPASEARMLYADLGADADPAVVPSPSPAVVPSPSADRSALAEIPSGS